MRYLFAALMVFVAAQDPANPFPNHEEPPPGWYCTHNDPTPAHNCACHRVDDDPLCEGTPHEMANCKVYCHADHCHCPVVCEPAQQ